MKIGVLGSGDVGRALAVAFNTEGHDVMIATRNTKSQKAAKLTKLGLKVGDFAKTAQFAEVAVLCTLWSATQDAIAAIGPKNLANKIVIDVTNPFDFSKGMPPSLAVSGNDSGGETVQRWLPKSLVVKAFNSVGNEHMYKPLFANGLPTMFYCGNDAGAKEVVKSILFSFGWQPIDIGDIAGSRELEALCILWVKIGISTGNWQNAFAVLSK